MKKLILLVAISVMACTLVGCKSASVDITKSDEALITVNGTDITKGEVFAVAKKSYGASYTLNNALNIVTDKEKIALTDTMKKEADTQMKTLRDSGGDDFLKQLTTAGYKDENDYKEKVIYPNLRQQGLVRKYVETKQKSMFKTYSPRIAQILQADTKEKAQAALKAVQAGTSMSEAATANGNTTTFKGTEEIYTSKSEVASAVFSKIKAAKKAGVLTSIIEDSANNAYYVVNVTNVDPNSFKEKAIDKIVETGSSELSTASSLYYLDKYDFEVYDKDVYDGLKQIDAKYVEN